jgi:hypothetical protein
MLTSLYGELLIQGRQEYMKHSWPTPAVFPLVSLLPKRIVKNGELSTVEKNDKYSGCTLYLYLAAIGIGAGGGWWLANKLTPGSLAVRVGVAVAVLASIPTFIILILAVRVFQPRQEPQSARQYPTHQPPVIIVNPQDRARPKHLSRGDYDSPPQPRHWVIADGSEDKN